MKKLTSLLFIPALLTPGFLAAQDLDSAPLSKPHTVIETEVTTTRPATAGEISAETQAMLLDAQQRPGSADRRNLLRYDPSTR